MFIFIKIPNTIIIFLLGVIEIKFLEASYDKTLKLLFNITNPAKKLMIKTHCAVHKFININALNILENDQYIKEHNFFFHYIVDINEGAVWQIRILKVPSIFIILILKKDYMDRQPFFRQNYSEQEYTF